MTTGDPKHHVFAEGRILATDSETVVTDTLSIAGFESVEKDGEIDFAVNANKATYTITDPGADAYLIHVVGWNGGGNAELGIRPNDYGAGTGEDTYYWHSASGTNLSNDTSWGVGSHGSSQNRAGFVRVLIRRAGGDNWVGMGHLGGWSASGGDTALHGFINESDPFGGEITSFVFRERGGNDLTAGTARIARVTLG